MKKIDKILFYFPWNEISGGPFYMAQLANNLSEKKNYTVYYVDYANSGTGITLNKKINRLIYNDNESFIFDNFPVVCIMPVYLPHSIPKLHKNSKFLFVNWHNCCTMVLQSKYHLNNDSLLKMLYYFENTKSVVYCDYAHFLEVKKYIKNPKERYLPVVINKNEEYFSSKGDNVLASQVNIAILGRICRDKIYSIFNILDNLEKLNYILPINIHIIGDGNEKLFLNKYIKKYNNINIIQHGVLIGKERDLFLIKNIDVLFGMGTSILEGAKLKIPCVVTPHQLTFFKNDKFVYLHECRKYCLGWFNEQLDDLGFNTITIKDILDDIYIKKKKKVLGEKAFDHLQNNHFENIKMLEEHVEKSTSYFYDFEKMNIFSKEKKVKIFNFCIFSYSIFLNSVKYKLFGKIELCKTIKSELSITDMYVLYFPLIRIRKTTNVYRIDLLFIIKIYNFLKGKK
ncbi:hypothetical protein L8U98_00850 [Campylobacter sp. RKI_CA19_01128]|uniref:hypothetical protein n=1 Tax=Campylobacter TaxID=194 RepID=UPI0021E947A6|nr:MULTISPECIES: hypothetical protein [unclassified Campylobacter]MCV3348335.1 hypothetical protein [Campylobacter sp. RKI_CA19_01127]MCV3354406.1 hypothetical protein [Campylobacter sp. RKI_CA19_01128]HEC1775801.1 hypothetical protein [Campylobacter lari]